MGVPVNVPVNRLAELVALVKENPKVTILQMATTLGVTSQTVKRDLAKLKQDQLIRRVGSDKSGYWEVTSKAADGRQ